MEEPVPEHHRHPCVGEPIRDVAPLVGTQPLEVEVGDLGPAQELEREDAGGRVLANHAWHDDVAVASEVAVEHLRVARFVAVVELEADRARELVDELLRVHELERLDALLQELRGLVQETDVRLDLTGRRGTLHLDRDFLTVGQHRTVHLPDRGRREGREVELEEGSVHAQLELGLHGVPYLLERDGRRCILQPPQLDDDVRWHDVRPGGEQLAELDEGRAELVEHQPQAAPAIRDGGLVPVRARSQVPHAVPAQEVAEPVARRDLGDLGEPTDAPRWPGLRRGHSRIVGRVSERL